MTTKQFHLGTLLSISDGRLVAPNGIDDVYAILNWMTGESLYTHQLPRAGRECRPHLNAQHPFLTSDAMKKHLDHLTSLLMAEGIDPKDAVEGWMVGMVACFGEFHEVEPTPGAHEPCDPIQELAEMMPDKPIVAVKLPKE